MPIYEYQASSPDKCCAHCRSGFECLQRLSETALDKCPECGAPVTKQISAPSVGMSRSCLDDRAKNAGFTKYKKLGKGEYEKQY